MQELQSKLRQVTPEDREKLLSASFSKFDLFNNCNRRYDLKYNKGMHVGSITLPLELGSILHKGLEMKGNYLIDGLTVDYDVIRKAVMDGADEITPKSKHHIFGVNEIKERHKEAWLESYEDEDGVPYDQKIALYLNSVLPTRMEDEEWTVKGTEIPFEYVYDDRVIIKGFIDRVDSKEDENGNEILKVIDYKSSKKVFPDTKIKTPMQMVIYDLACFHLFGILPEYHEYDFILLDKKQTSKDGVCSKGYLKRGIKKIDSILDKIEESESEKEYMPSPTPLCYWCPYAGLAYTPNADIKYGGECQYHSLWTPENKVFTVNKEYIPGEEESEKPVRKLVF